MLYNLPGATGVNLSPELVGRLVDEVPNIRYIKDTSADMAQAGQFVHRLGDRIGTFIGWDSLTLASLVEGAAGVMAGTANVFPHELVAVHDAVASGDLATARERWAELYPLMDAIMSAPFIQAVKAALVALGIPVGPPREPLLPLDVETAARIDSLVTAWRRTKEVPV
jgi:4-hydroxy-tetrahydrodipicolinate synthase